MFRMVVFCLTALIFLVGNPVAAGIIYTWTDADGVKRYSNFQPPEDVENVQTIQELQYDRPSDDQARREYDRMVEDASRSADRQFEEQAKKKALAAKALRQQHQDKQARQIDEERIRLQKELDGIQKRGLGPTFSPGQKENLIRQVQEKIDQLESSPEGIATK